jgi:hypothetical protein
VAAAALPSTPHPLPRLWAPGGSFFWLYFTTDANFATAESELMYFRNLKQCIDGLKPINFQKKKLAPVLLHFCCLFEWCCCQAGKSCGGLELLLRHFTSFLAE